MGQSLNVCRYTEKGHAPLGRRRVALNDKKHKKLKVRLAEIHLGKLGKLDRAEKRDPNAAPPELPLAPTPTGVNDADYQPPFTFTGKIDKITLTIDRPKLSPADIQKIQEAEHDKKVSE